MVISHNIRSYDCAKALACRNIAKYYSIANLQAISITLLVSRVTILCLHIQSNHKNALILIAHNYPGQRWSAKLMLPELLNKFQRNLANAIDFKVTGYF